MPVLNHLAEQNSGRTGYRLTIDDGRLWASLAHSPPANMIAIETLRSAARRRVDAHHADVRRLEPRRGAQALLERQAARRRAVVRDQLTRTILPFTSADVFDPFLGLAVGTRFREKAPVGSGIDELRVFERDLTPVEIAFLHDETLARRTGAKPSSPSCWRRPTSQSSRRTPR